LLAADVLADVLDTRALVRLGRIERADARGGFADLRLVNAGDRDLQTVVLDGDLQPFGDREDLRGCETERKRELLALQDGLEAGYYFY
jgi:hypothetical protein